MIRLLSKTLRLTSIVKAMSKMFKSQNGRNVMKELHVAAPCTTVWALTGVMHIKLTTARCKIHPLSDTVKLVMMSTLH